jgi:hypothetical protein
MRVEEKIEAAHTLVRMFGGFTWGNARARADLVPYARQRGPGDCCGPVRHGHCDCCGEKLSDTAFMTTDKWDGAVPVCESCATNLKAELRRPMECPGCGLVLSVPTSREWRHIKACSNICYQRGRRKSQRFKQLVCETCKTAFQSSRKDAKFCSGACRQLTYRRRHFAAEPAVAGNGAATLGNGSLNHN